MTEPPPHQGPFARAALIETAAELLGEITTPDYALQCLRLLPGKLTLVTGASNSVRSRFLIGLIGGVLMESLRDETAPTLWFFNRRWTDLEARRSLLRFLASRLSQREGAAQTDVMLWAMEAVQNSGLVYDNVSATISEVCRKAALESAAHPGRLVIVDGVEHFDSANRGKGQNFLELRQLRKLARETCLPVLVTCPSWDCINQEAIKLLADRVIQLSD